MRALLSIFIILVFSSPYLEAKNRGISSFMDAVQYGNIDIINDYIQAGVDLNAQVGNATALICAVERGDINIVRLLVFSGADPDSLIIDNGSQKKSATSVAIHQPEILEFLIESGADVNLKLSQRKSLLHLTAEIHSQHNEDLYNSFCILINHNSTIDAKDLAGNTPLHSASRYRKWKFVTDLIDNGGYLYARDDTGNTPLHLIYAQVDIAMLKELVLRKIPLDDLQHGPYTALHSACSTGSLGKKKQLELIKFLVEEQRMDVNQYSMDYTGNTLSFTALMIGLQTQIYYEDDFEILEYLLEKGADINAPYGITKYPDRPVGKQISIIQGSVLSWAIMIKLPQYITEWMVLHGAKVIPGGWK